MKFAALAHPVLRHDAHLALPVAHGQERVAHHRLIIWIGLDAGLLARALAALPEPQWRGRPREAARESKLPPLQRRREIGHRGEPPPRHRPAPGQLLAHHRRRQSVKKLHFHRQPIRVVQSHHHFLRDPQRQPPGQPALHAQRAAYESQRRIQCCHHDQAARPHLPKNGEAHPDRGADAQDGSQAEKAEQAKRGNHG